MGDDKRTDEVRPSKRRDSGPVSLSDGRISVKTGLVVSILLSAVLGTGGFLGIRTAAPDPEVVKKTANDVGDIKEAIIQLTAELKAQRQRQDQQGAEWERRFADQQRDIDKLEGLMATQREVDELKARVAKLEAGGK